VSVPKQSLPLPQPTPPVQAPLALAPAPAAPAAARELWAGLHLPGIEGSGSLEELARALLHFSPRVSLEPPDGLVLEVRGSLPLFAGLSGMRAALVAACTQLRLRPRLAIAPTPLAALIAARAGLEVAITEAAQLTGTLAPLSLSVLRWPPPLPERLRRIGVRTLGALLRLPRAGFARRFGVAELATLDRLVGRAPELRTAYVPHLRYRRRHELSCEVDSHAWLLNELGGLLAGLEHFLTGRQLGVMTLECRLHHRNCPPSRCVLNLASPSAQAAHLAALFAEQFARLALPGPVRALELRARALLPRVARARTLWQPGEHGGDGAGEAHLLIERLRARLGAEAIHGLTLRDAHRPEGSWTATEPPPPAPRTVPAPAGAPGVQRPLWLLPVPQPLPVQGGLPQRGGGLQLLGEPERIESGWWDQRPVARDYYAARDVHGVRLWVFRERHPPHGWFLHGFFG